MTIKFRGKIRGKDEWFYGSYVNDVTGHFIIDYSGIRKEVDPKTVGQFTGLTDENKKEIEEILKIKLEKVREQNNKEWREKIDIIITAQEKRYEYNLKMYKKSNNELFDDNIEKNLEVINALEYLKDN